MPDCDHIESELAALETERNDLRTELQTAASGKAELVAEIKKVREAITAKQIELDNCRGIVHDQVESRLDGTATLIGDWSYYGADKPAWQNVERESAPALCSLRFVHYDQCTRISFDTATWPVLSLVDDRDNPSASVTVSAEQWLGDWGSPADVRYGALQGWLAFAVDFWTSTHDDWVNLGYTRRGALQGNLFPDPSSPDEHYQVNIYAWAPAVAGHNRTFFDKLFGFRSEQVQLLATIRFLGELTPMRPCGV
jgi:hypothetical protein